MNSERSRIEVPFIAPSSHRLMSVASIVPEAYPSDGPATEADRAAATELIGDLLGDYLEYPASHFPGPISRRPTPGLCSREPGGRCATGRMFLMSWSASQQASPQTTLQKISKEFSIPRENFVRMHR